MNESSSRNWSDSNEIGIFHITFRKMGKLVKAHFIS